MRISEYNSAKVRQCGFLCSLLVVGLHISYTPEGDDAFRWLFYIQHTIGRIAVPMFFVFSGFFVECNFDRGGGYVSVVKKRVRSVMIPYFVCNIIWLIMTLFAMIAANFLHHRELLCVPITGFDFLDAIGLGYAPWHGPSWFLRNLFLLVLVSPFIRWVLDRFSMLYLIIIFGYSVWSEGPLLWTFRASGLFYFSVGMVICRRVVCCALGKAFRWGIVGGAVALGVLTILGLEEQKSFARWVEPFFVAVAVMAIWELVPKAVVPERIARLSFPLYLIHPFVLWGSRQIWVAKSCLIWVATLAVCLVISYFLIFSLNRCFPRFSNVMFGGRG